MDKTELLVDPAHNVCSNPSSTSGSSGFGSGVCPSSLTSSQCPQVHLKRLAAPERFVTTVTNLIVPPQTAHFTEALGVFIRVQKARFVPKLAKGPVRLKARQANQKA
ncbi:MAG: hypothetical protein U1G07_27975 [Verrucomicrobiota bacterium]